MSGQLRAGKEAMELHRLLSMIAFITLAAGLAHASVDTPVAQSGV